MQNLTPHYSPLIQRCAQIKWSLWPLSPLFFFHFYGELPHPFCMPMLDLDQYITILVVGFLLLLSCNPMLYQRRIHTTFMWKNLTNMEKRELFFPNVSHDCWRVSRKTFGFEWQTKTPSHTLVWKFPPFASSFFLKFFFLLCYFLLLVMAQNFLM
jgi:hypothetical protein